MKKNLLTSNLSKIILVGALFLVKTAIVQAKDFSYKDATEINPNDYLFKSQDDDYGDVFEQFRTIDLGVDLNISSDCGKINITSTYQAALKNLLDTKYFGKIGMDILSASPMLLACYYSPTWCAVLKHTQITANFLSQMRLDQCAVIDKYIDGRADDFYKERQDCIHKAIEDNGGDMESAMQACNNNKIADFDLSNWTGDQGEEKKETNKLIEDSVKWAGFEGKEANETLDLLKSFVGDTIVSKGKVSVEYGSKNIAITPTSHLAAIEEATHQKLCEKLLKKVDKRLNKEHFRYIVSNKDLKNISGDKKKILIDRQTIMALAYMPHRARSLACKKLSSAIAMTLFSNQMNKTLDLLTIAAQNTNLPVKRKQEINNKKESLKSSIEMTLELKKQRNTPLNKVTSLINQQGNKYRHQVIKRQLSNNVDSINKRNVRRIFMDCADSLFCERGL